MQDIRMINEHQKEYYEAMDKKMAAINLERYSELLNLYRDKKSVKIVDIGGASGYFSLALKEYFSDISCEIYCVDTTKYDSWQNNMNKITFINDSASSLSTLFERNTIDIVFANMVFHHFVKNTWNDTVNGMNSILKQIYYILKDGLTGGGGHLCIAEQFYNGIIYDKSTSKIIYTLTSNKIPFMTNIIKKFGAHSAGVGVCFLSKKMWVDVLTNNGFMIDCLEETIPMKVEWYKKLFLLINKYTDNNMILCHKP